MATGTGDTNSFWPMVCADGHRQLLRCCSAGGKSQADFEERDSRLPGVWPPQPLPPSTDCRWVQGTKQPVQAKVKEELLLRASPLLGCGWHGMNIAVFAAVCLYQLPEGLAVSFSVPALAAREARHTQQSGEEAERGCLARKAGACFGALLRNMAPLAGGNASAGG